MSAPSFELPPVDAGQDLDHAAVAHFAAPLLTQVERVAAGLPTGAAARLVAELADVERALHAPDAAASRRRVGLWGRLLGRDVAEQAHADALYGRLDVVLLRADVAAAQLRQERAQLSEAAVMLASAAEAIDRWVEAGAQAAIRADDALVDVWQRRVTHLRSVAALRRVDVQQAQLLMEQSVELLERYQRIREVLVPAWQQQQHALRARAGAAQAQQVADGSRRILDEVAAMQARLRRSP